MTPNPWLVSWRYDPRIARMADRHYSRLTVGASGFCGSGRPLVLRTRDYSAAWVSFWQPVPTHKWKQSWTNSLFRNEGSAKASHLIRSAVAVTRHVWGEPPSDGFITFVDPSKVREKQTPGHCYVIAGWRRAGTSSTGLVAMQLTPDRFPPPEAPDSDQFGFDFESSA